MGRRIALGFLVTASVQLVLGGIGIAHTMSVGGSVDTARDSVARLHTIDEVEHRWSAVRTAVEQAILNRRDSVVGELVDPPLAEFRSAVQRIRAAPDGRSTTGPDAGRDAAALLGADAADVVERLAGEVREGRWAAAQAVAHTDLTSVDRRFAAALARWRATIESAVRQSSTESGAGASALLWYWTTSSGALVLAIVVVGFVTTRRITRPVNALVADVARLTDGDFSAVCASTQQDEIGVLSRSFAAMTERLHRTYADLLARVDELWHSEERFRALVESAPDSIVILDADERVVLANGRAERMFGYPRAELLQVPLRVLVPRWRAVDAASAQAPDNSVPQEVEAVRRDGSTFPVEITTSRVGTEHGTLVTTILRDVTERKRFEDQLVYLADHDALTGLLNRRRFERELAEHLARVCRNGGPGGAVLLLDLDNLKYVNDSLGHTVGDDLIKSVAGVLRARLRTTDVLARLGGDEFAVLVAGAGIESASLVAQDLLAALRGHNVTGGSSRVQTTTSIGIAVIDDCSMSVSELLIAADLAMYEAKDGGRDQAAVFSPEHRKQADAPLNWSTRIRRCLEEDGFELHLQPILDLRLGAVTHHEALVRMSDPDGPIAPSAFLPTAERFGLVTSIDRWVVSTAVHCIADAGVRGERLVLEVNLSGKSVTDRDLLDYISAAIQAARIDPAQLIFEITETAAIANMAEAARFARDLTGLGARFALDDFGAGFASFYYLKHLPLSYLKLDGDFIRSLPTSPTDKLLVRAMVQVARGLGLQTIAEFVGDANTIEVLTELEVDYAQGFHVGRPVPAADVLAGGTPARTP